MSDPVNKGIQSNLVTYPFSKNVAEYIKDSPTLELVSNDLQLYLKETPLQQGSGSHPHPSTKETNNFYCKFKTYCQKRHRWLHSKNC